MSSWIKTIPVEETSPEKEYFVGRTWSGTHFDFWSRGLNGKESFTQKPGIALRFVGGQKLVKAFAANPTVKLVAIEIPEDADTRWRARKKRH